MSENLFNIVVGLTISSIATIFLMEWIKSKRK